MQMKWSSAFAPHLRMMSFFSFFLWFILLSTLPLSDVWVVHAFTGTYGVNYGRIADNLPPPESVVTLLKAAKIKNVRIYDADQAVLRAFRGSGIEITVGLGNEFLRDISVNEDRAVEWLKQNVEPFLPGTHIAGIAVGNEILGGGDVELWEVLVPAVKNVYNALDRLGLAKKIEVSSPHSEAVFAISFPPSAGAFKENVLPYMKPLLQFFSQIGSPFYINAYPFLAYKSDPSHIDLNYALFQKNPGIYDAKTKLHYDDMFEAQIDAAYAALEKVGFSKMDVIVSETGWASKGDENEAGANLKNARTYNLNLRRKLLKKRGTPYRPKKVVKAYVFALFNENSKPGPTSERNFGLFKPDGSVAYNIGFTGLVPSSASSFLGSIKHDDYAFAAAQNVHTVGDGMGWDIPHNTSVSYTNWASGKTFMVGDILVFNFVTNQHDVVQVPQASYDACTQDHAIGNIITAGPANITIDSAGDHYYICTFGSHCRAGQRLAIRVVSSTPGGATPPMTAPPANPRTPSPASPNAGGPAAGPTPRGLPPPPDSAASSLASGFLLVTVFAGMALVL